MNSFLIYCQTSLECDRLFIAVDCHLRAINAIWHGVDRLAHGSDGRFNDVSRKIIQRIESELVKHICETRDTRIVAGQQRTNITHDLDRVATVGLNNTEQVIIQCTC